MYFAAPQAGIAAFEQIIRDEFALCANTFTTDTCLRGLNPRRLLVRAPHAASPVPKRINRPARTTIHLYPYTVLRHQYLNPAAREAHLSHQPLLRLRVSLVMNSFMDVCQRMTLDAPLHWRKCLPKI